MRGIARKPRPTSTKSRETVTLTMNEGRSFLTVQTAK